MTTIEAGSTGPSLLVLPMDILTVVQSFMKPLDIKALQSTCKTLRDPTLRRTVWRAALRRVIEQNDVFAPTFPSLQTMSTSELSYAALRPQVFLQRVERCASSCPEDKIGYLKPLRRQEVQLNIREIDIGEYTDQFSAASLVSGGRYLLVLLSFTIYIYDLGELRPELDPIFITTTKDLEPLPTPWPLRFHLDFHVARGGDLLLFISFLTRQTHDNTDDFWACARVYKVQGLPDTPHGELMGRLDFKVSSMYSNLSLWCLEGDLVSFTMYGEPNSQVVGVGDYVHSEVASWSCPRASMCIIKRNHLIVGNYGRGLLVYELPPLCPLATETLEHSVLEPIQIIPAVEGLNPLPIAVYQRSVGVPLFDAFLENKSEMPAKLVRYRIDIPCLDDAPSLEDAPSPDDALSPNGPNASFSLVIESTFDATREGPGRRAAISRTLRACDDSMVHTRAIEPDSDSGEKDRERVTIHVEHGDGEAVIAGHNQVGGTKERVFSLVDLVDRREGTWNFDTDAAPEESTWANSERAMSLLTLPLDLLVLVHSHLTPLDILSLHATCRTLRSPTLGLLVWRDALRHSIEENNIFGPTFDLASMSVSALRTASLRHQVLLRVIKSRSPSSQSFDPRYLWPRSHRKITLDRGFLLRMMRQRQDNAREMTLLQGGRYLLLDTVCTFRVYDLDDSERKEPEMTLKPIMFWIKSDDDQDIPTLPGRCVLRMHKVEGDEVILFFSIPAIATGFLPTSLVAYAIRGLPHQPLGEEIARYSLKGPGELLPKSFSSDRVSFVGSESDVFGVWDYRRDEVVLMRTPPDWSRRDSSIECLITPNTVILKSSNAKKLGVYDLPPFAPTTAPPVYAPAYRDVLHSQAIIKSCQILPLHDSNGPYLFDLHPFKGDGRFHRYRLEADPTSGLFMPVPDTAWMQLYPVGMHPVQKYDMKNCQLRPLRAWADDVFVVGYRTGWRDSEIRYKYRARDEDLDGHGEGEDEEDNGSDWTIDSDEATNDDQANVFLHVQHRDLEKGLDRKYPLSIASILDRSHEAWGERRWEFVEFCPASGRLLTVEVLSMNRLELNVFDYFPSVEA
ncbi:uncharacterized protein SCHCODRAFT_02522630 [Schizophyllum commune H4-8]|nr:uncharacterized protein SCHCODRAFT_02522630 [Schizophyllum commune H4-8]KAI5899111.1 hypothetical protein SCHCODRAFT_02522630 [Schizophyllum commune H4-8]